MPDGSPGSPASPATIRAQARASSTHRVLDAARALTIDQGWRAVTMGAVAREAGVRRQALYETIGTKTELGEALVAREMEDFLTAVATAMTSTGDALDALDRGARAALEMAASNPLLRAILQGAGSGDAELLPLLTSDPAPVLQRALGLVTLLLQGLLPTLAPAQTSLVAEVSVRLILSHIFQPTGPIEDALAQFRTVARALVVESAG